MDRYDAKKVTPVEASPKLDGVYARATRDGIFTKSGQKMPMAHVEARLRRYFRKNPAGALEGEVWRKGAGIEAIAGEARSGKTENLRLHVYPGQADRPWGIGAVRRVPGWKVKDDAGVQAALARALRKGHEGVVVKGADGVKVKLKPQMDAEWKVENLKAGRKKTVLTMRTADGKPFKVQAGGGAAAAKVGDQVQVRYSGLTRSGKPKAAVAVRVRETQDFKTQDARKEMKNFQSTVIGQRSAVSGKAEMTDRQQEQVRKDRKALLKGAILTAAGVGAGYLLLRGEKAGDVKPVAAKPVPMPKWKVEHPGLPAPRRELPPLRQRVTEWGPRRAKETYTPDVIYGKGPKAPPKPRGPGMKVAARANNERKGGVKRLIKAAELKRERAWGALKPPSSKRIAKLAPAVRAEYERLDAAARMTKPIRVPKAAAGQVTPWEQSESLRGSRKVNRQILQGYREQKNFSMKTQDNKTKRDGLSKARDAALLAGGLGVLGASGYGAMRAHKLYKVAKKAIPRQARKLRKTAEGALRAAREELPEIRKATDVTQQKIQETAKRVQDSADNVVNSTAVYSDIGKLYKGAKGGLGNLLNPRRTLREVKSAFKSGYRSGRYGAPDSFTPEPRAKWELSTPAERMLRGFEDKPMSHEEMVRLYGQKKKPETRDQKPEKRRGFFFETPASRLIGFGNAEQWREKDTRRYGNPLKAAAGMEKGYFQIDPVTKEPIERDIPLMHAQVLKSAYNKAHNIQKHATRVGSLGSDVVAVATGKPRERDQAGREKKREWEKPWFKTAARNVAVTGAMLYGAKRLKDNPSERAWVKRQVNKGVRKVNSWTPDMLKEWEEGQRSAVSGQRVKNFARGERLAKFFPQHEDSILRWAKVPKRKFMKMAGDLPDSVAAARALRGQGVKSGVMRVSDFPGMPVRREFATPAARLLGKFEGPLRKGPLGKLMGPSKAQRTVAGQREALVARLKAAAAKGNEKAAGMVNRASKHAAMKQAGVKAAERRKKDAVRGLKKGAGIAAGGAVLGGSAMKLHADQPEDRKVNQGARFRNALVGAAAGSFLGGALHAGKSGFRGARVGAALGGLVGAVGNPKRKQIIEELPLASFEARDQRPDSRDQMKSFQTPAGRVIEFGKVPFRGITVKRYPGQKLRPGSARGVWANYVADTWGVPAKHSAEAVEAARKIRVFKKNPVGKEIEGARKALLKDPELGRWVKNKSTPTLVVEGKYGKEIYKKGSREVKDEINRLNIGRARGKSVKVGMGMIGAPYVETDFQTPAGRVLNFDMDAAMAGWDVRDPRGKSARVFAPGSRQRYRRPKEWHEKKENRDKIAAALIATAGIAGLAGGVKIGKKLALKKKLPVTPPAPSAGYGYGPTMGPRSTVRREGFRSGKVDRPRW